MSDDGHALYWGVRGTKQLFKTKKEALACARSVKASHPDFNSMDNVFHKRSEREAEEEAAKPYRRTQEAVREVRHRQARRRRLLTAVPAVAGSALLTLLIQRSVMYLLDNLTTKAYAAAKDLRLKQ